MNTKSILIGFGAGALLAAGITYFAIQGNKDPEPAPAPVVAQQPAEPAPVAAPPPVMEPEPAPPVSRFRRATAADKPVRRAKAAPAPAAKPAPAAVETPKPVAQVTEPEKPVMAPPPYIPPPKASEPEPQKPAEPPAPNKVTLAAGTMLPVRLIDSLDSERNQPGEAFYATLDQPLIVDGFVIAERGAKVEGRIAAAREAGRVKGLSQMALELTHIKTSDGQRIAVSTSTFEKEGEKSTKSDATKVAVGAGVGAALGAILGGGKGAAIGSAAGAGAGAGTVLATRGKPVQLPAESRITFSLKAPVTVTEKR